MRLSDIMGSLDLSIYPQVAMVIFVAVFAAVMVRLFGRSRSGELNRAAALPLEETNHVNGSMP